MYTNEDLLVAAAAIIIVEREMRHEPCKQWFWVRPSLRGRAQYGVSDLMKYLILDDVDELNLEYRCGGGFRNFFRMSSSDFETLFNLTGSKISKGDTSFRKAIPAHECIAVTLQFLATGDSYHSLMYMFKISKQAISKIIPNVCDALVNVLQDYNDVRIKTTIH
jgi:hypothetical protein